MPEEYYVNAIGQSVAADNPGHPADDAVAAVVWDGQLADTEGSDMSVMDLRATVIERHVTVYHFPVSRVVAETEIKDLRLQTLAPSPYHCREFDPDENQQYINAVRGLGYVESVPVARPVGDRYELVDGHKRRWVAERAGLETLAVEIVALNDWEAANRYVRAHSATLGEGETKQLMAVLSARWGDRVDELTPP